MRLCLSRKNPFIRERLWHICYFTFKFDLKMAHLPSSCLLVAEVNAPLKNASSVFLDTSSSLLQPEMISKEINPKKIIFYSLCKLSFQYVNYCSA
jgi:hypothetical protein